MTPNSYFAMIVIGKESFPQFTSHSHSIYIFSGYHMYCCSPQLSQAPEGDWRCKLCCAQFGELPS